MPDRQTRKKNAKEKAHDEECLRDAERTMVQAAVDFIDEFQECEGDVWHSTYNKASRALWDLRHTQRIIKTTHVGEQWDMENGIAGFYRYEHLT